MNNLNHAKYVLIWRRSRGGEVQVEEHHDLELVLARRAVLNNLSYVNHHTITVYRQQEITKGQEVTKVVRYLPPELV